MKPNDPRHDWIQQYVDGTASAEVVAQLETSLREDKEFRALFLEYLSLDSALPAEVKVPAEAKITPFRPPIRSAFSHRWLAVAAIFLAALAAAIWLLPPLTAEKDVALLRRSFGAAWDGSVLSANQKLTPGWIKLTSGVAQMNFHRGARVVLEGPAEFQIVSNNEGVLRRGRLRAFVPPSAHGFTVHGEGFTVIDHGTEFGIEVDGTPEVHVFAGNVIARNQYDRALGKNEGVRFNASGTMELIKAQPNRFLSEQRLNAWEASEKLSAHPSAVAHFDFAAAPGVLANRVPNHPLVAAAIGTPETGRWPASRALSFQSADDRVRLVVPGELQSLTLFAWVWVDSIPSTQSSLLMSEAEQPGDVHWFLHESGTIGFAVIGPDQRWHGAHSPAVLRREMFKRWNSIAVTYDHATRSVTHYFNGRSINTQSLDAGGPIRLRAVEIGNWGLRPGAVLRASKRLVAEPEGYVRTLRGRVDEFAILATPLSASEILHLHENGQP